MTAPSGLARKSISTSSLFFFCVGASAPMTVLAGGVVQTYALTGVIGVPVSFLVLAGALAFFTVGYVAMARYVPHAATFYALLARGLGRAWGLAGGTVALVAYNCIQISLYGLLGVTVSAFFNNTGAWWLWALVAWAVVGLLGILHINVNARVLAVLLVLEIAVILLFDLAAFTHAADGVTVKPLTPGSLFEAGLGGLGGVFALGIAAFVGYESGPFYGEEARTQRVVARASFGALAFIGVLYAVSSWAMAVTVGVGTVGTGPDAAPGVVAAARTPGPPIPLGVLDTHYGGAVSKLGNLLLITSIVAAMISFHNSFARYVFGMARERVLAARLGHIRPGARGGAPVGGSLLQSAIALVVIAAFALAGSDPVTTMFTWLSSMAAIGVMLLMLATSLSVIVFFGRGGGSGETLWQRVWAPALGAVVLAVVLLITMANLYKLLNTPRFALLTWILPGIIVLAAVVGLLWARVLQRSRPEVYRNIGVGETEPLAVLEHALANLKV
jgi:amino acid transporter